MSRGRRAAPVERRTSAEATAASPLLARTRAKVRYYVAGLRVHQALLRTLIDGCAKLGVRIEPFHLVREGLSLAEATAPAAGDQGLEAVYLGAEEMEALAAIPGRTPTAAELRRRLDEGRRCLALRRQGGIVAFTWLDLEACRFEGLPLFGLAPDEAYLFDAYTLESERGSGLAPLMRRRAYEELARLGRQRCYSVTVLYNAPAARFKAKLGARVVALHLLVELFGRWRWLRVLRRRGA